MNGMNPVKQHLKLRKYFLSITSLINVPMAAAWLSW